MNDLTLAREAAEQARTSARDLLIQAWQTVFPHPLPPVFNVMAGHIVVTLEDA